MGIRSRVLFGATLLSTITLLLVFSLSDYSRPSRTRVIDTWHDVKDKVQDNLPANNGTPTRPKAKPLDPTSCNEDLSFLAEYKLTPSIRYASRQIIAVQEASSGRPSVTDIKEPLFPELVSTNLNASKAFKPEKCLSPLYLSVAQPPHAPEDAIDASSLMFGMQTTLSRLHDTVKHLERWLAYSQAKLHAIVQEKEGEPANDAEMVILQEVFKNRHMDALVRHPLNKEHVFQQRYFSIVESLYEARTPNTKWIILVDDDTFYPNMKRLMAALDKFDHTQPMYVGAISEDWNAIQRYGIMGFGGAGIYLSVPMAEIIVAHKEECNDHTRTSAGDITVFDCIYRFTEVKLTPLVGAHQMDLYKNQGGVYESGRQFVALHHWKGESEIPIEKMHTIFDLCQDCFLQRWKFPNELLLSNGYSITHYPYGHLSGREPPRAGALKGTIVQPAPPPPPPPPSPTAEPVKEGEEPKPPPPPPPGPPKLEAVDLFRLEQTWYDHGKFDVEHSIGPTRPGLEEWEKITFRLEDVIKGTGGGLKQVYVKRGSEGEEDMVMVLDWRSGTLAEQT